MKDLNQQIETWVKQFEGQIYTPDNVQRIRHGISHILDNEIAKGNIPRKEYDITIDWEGSTMIVDVIRKIEPVTAEEDETAQKYDMGKVFFNNSGQFVKYLKSHKFSKKEIKFIEDRVRNSIRDCDCVDNFRYYSKSGVIRSRKTSYERGRYDTLKENGCCGFYDEEVHLNSGKMFVFGFNHGH